MAPNDVGVQTRLASVRMGMGDVDTAMGDLEHTLELAPKLPAVGEALFFAALATGDTAKAADALAKIKAAQGQTEIVGNLDGLFKLAQIDFPGAKATFTDLVQKYPDFTPAKINLARVDIILGDRPAAETNPDRHPRQAAGRRTGDVDDGFGLRPVEPAAGRDRPAGARARRRTQPDPRDRHPGRTLHPRRHRAKGPRPRRGGKGRQRQRHRHHEPESRRLSRAGAEEGCPRRPTPKSSRTTAT